MKRTISFPKNKIANAFGIYMRILPKALRNFDRFAFMNTFSSTEAEVHSSAICIAQNIHFRWKLPVVGQAQSLLCRSSVKQNLEHDVILCDVMFVFFQNIIFTVFKKILFEHYFKIPQVSKEETIYTLNETSDFLMCKKYKLLSLGTSLCIFHTSFEHIKTNKSTINLNTIYYHRNVYIVAESF